MKHAFIIGSNAFIVPGGTIFYGDKEHDEAFLKINTIYHDTKNPDDSSHLDVDLNIKDTDGTDIIVTGNKVEAGSPYNITQTRDSVKVLRPDGSLVIHVHQLDDEAAMSLEHNVTAELDIHAPVVAIRLTGVFLLDTLHIVAENEKLYINEIGYASSARAGNNKLVFTAEGLLL
jgi:hypothetical protein